MADTSVAEQFEKNKQNFILTEIESGIAFGRIARDADYQQKRERNLENARKAFYTAQHFLTEGDLPTEAVQAIAEPCES
jgi:hypothetical protein